MSTQAKIWIEVSLNGPHNEAAQPLAPHSVSRIVEEGLACAEAGAAIVHFHAFDHVTGTQCYDADTYGGSLKASERTAKPSSMAPSR